MAGSTFGNIFSITTWGESHGKGIGVVIDGHQYYALVSEDEYRRNSLKQVISKYYDNSYTRVVSTLIEEEVLTIDELQKLIQQIKNK